MNRERAKALLPIIQAFAEGKTIQCRNLDSDAPPIREWRSIGDVEFLDDFEYRIKPEPMEIWVNFFNDGSIATWFSEFDAVICERSKENSEGGRKTVNTKHFREVTE